MDDAAKQQLREMRNVMDTITASANADIQNGKPIDANDVRVPLVDIAAAVKNLSMILEKLSEAQAREA